MWKLFGTKTEERPNQRELELQARVYTLEKQMRDIQVDWDTTYDKFRLLYARVAKRVRDAQKLEDEPTTAHQDAPQSTIFPSGRGNGPIAPRVPRRNY